MNRYQIPGTQGEFQTGSDHLVLANKLGITSPDDMNELELGLLTQLYEDVLVNALPDRQLTVADLKTWHHRWLGNVYAWAGQERTVNMSKGTSCLQPPHKLHAYWPSLNAPVWQSGLRATT